MTASPYLARIETGVEVLALLVYGLRPDSDNHASLVALGYCGNCQHLCW